MSSSDVRDILKADDRKAYESMNKADFDELSDLVNALSELVSECREVLEKCKKK